MGVAATARAVLPTRLPDWPSHGWLTGNRVPSQVPIERNPWGELQEESSESEEETDEDGGGELDDDAFASESGVSSVTSLASMSSLASGLETPDAIDLRKDTGGSGPSQKLYQVIEQKETRVGGALMGSSHQYVVPAPEHTNIDTGAGPKGTAEALLRPKDDLNVTLDPKDLESDENMQAALARKFQSAQQEEAAKRSRDDLSGMVAEEEGRLAKKRKAAADKKNKDKAYKNVF
jgi:splicing factor 3B subunit 2